MAAGAEGTGAEVKRFICYPTKRRFPTAAALARHEQMSTLYQSTLEKREDKMRKRKRDLILAARTVRQRICESDEALENQTVVNEIVQMQRKVCEMQLQQLLGEYGQAQEVIEGCREAREARQGSAERPRHKREARVGRLALTAGVASWQSNKEVQEDRYILEIELESPEGHGIAGFCVLDGHSGSLCVDHVVEHLQGNLQKCLSSKAKLSDELLTQAVHEACMATDDEFLKKAREIEVLDGSTMILALVYPLVEPPGPNDTRAPGCCRLLIACVGDSRAVLCQAQTVPGTNSRQLVAAPLSEDHKPSRPDEARRIEAKGGIVDFEGVWRVFIPSPATFGGQLLQRWGLAVSRAFGDLLLKEAERYNCAGVAPGGLITAVPEIRIFDLQPAQDRFLVLASDGVWDVISNEDAIGICAAEKDVERAASMLLRRTYAANSDDNITALVLTWKEIESPVTTPGPSVIPTPIS